MSALILRDVHKRFGATEVLKGIDLEMGSGEFTVLVGPSGCGKSTLLNIVAGLDQPSAGTIEIGGRVVNDVAPKDRDIAMVFQSYALYPSMTVRQNITFGMECRHVPKKEQEAALANVARLLQIEPLLGRKPAQLSGGQRQRVAMGRALVRDPLLFLFDEPLSNLDAKLRVEMRMEIKQLHQRLRSTMVYVTHDQIEAMTLASRIAVMHQGELQQFVARDVLLGRRAECVAEANRRSGDAAASIAGSAPVGRGGPSGAETIVLMQLGGARVLGRVAPDVRLSVGATAPFTLDTRKTCLF